jgi:uncharacterized protein YcbK (DUF882 family)
VPTKIQPIKYISFSLSLKIMADTHRLHREGEGLGKLLSRRGFLQVSASAAAALLVNPVQAATRSHGRRVLSLHNLHTGESLARTYWVDGEYQAEAVHEISHLLRDFRTGQTHPIDPGLFDVLHRLQERVGSRKPFQVISGYRSPKTNAMLRGTSAHSGVAKKSLHMQGKAIDIRLPGQDLAKLRQAAISLKAGGVGYYPKSNFLHLDIGRVRHWS